MVQAGIFALFLCYPPVHGDISQCYSQLGPYATLSTCESEKSRITAGTNAVMRKYYRCLGHQDWYDPS